MLFIFSICASSSGQGALVFCDKLSSAGIPHDTLYSIITPPQGQQIIVHYSPASGTLPSPRIKMEVSNLGGHSNRNSDSQSFLIEPNKQFFSTRYLIKGEGDFRFRIKGPDGELLAEEIISASVEQTEVSNYETAPVHPTNLTDSSVYMEFFSLDNDLNTEFNFRNTRGVLRIRVSHLTAGEYTVDLWKQSTEAYDQFVSSGRYSFSDAADGIECNLSFPSGGKYKVVLFNSNGLALSTGFATLR